MLEIIKQVEQIRIEDCETILRNRETVRGLSEFRPSSVSKLDDHYVVSTVDPDNSEMSIHVAVDSNGNFLYSGRSYESNFDGDLTDAQRLAMNVPVPNPYKIFDEISFTFTEKGKDAQEIEDVKALEIAKIVEQVRVGIISESEVVVVLCESRSAAVRVVGGDILPSATDQLKKSDWEDVVLEAREQLGILDSTPMAA